ncbi:MAG: CAAX amino terminal protease family [Promethearchaeota archaeon]|nr:MAG: CAAX amino terminal protease family [Candidatus Lokiarchaeota archaeon]
MSEFKLIGFLTEKQVGSFFIFSYLISWLGFLPSLLGYEGIISQITLFIAQFGPALAAVFIIQLTDKSFKEWIKQIIHWHVPIRWWIATLTVPILIFGTTSVFFAMFVYQLKISMLINSLLSYFPTLLFSTLLAGLGEEPSWRGYALPRLQKKYGPFRATLLLGFIWALWHIPVFFIDPRSSHSITNPWLIAWMIFLTAIGIILYSFFYTWIYNKTQSILLMMILHGGFNTSTTYLVPFDNEIVFGPSYITLLTVQITIIFLGTIIILFITGGKLGYKPDIKTNHKNHKNIGKK